MAAPTFRSSLAWVPLAIALIWIGALIAAAELGTIAYAIPLLAAVAVVPAFVFLKGIQGRSYATVCLLVFVVFGLNLNFRERALGEVGLDWQNGLKLATWLALCTIAAARWRRVAPLFREPTLALCLIYVTIALASSAWSEVPLYTGASALGWLAYLGLGCLLIIDLDEDVAIRIMMWTLLAYVAVGAIGGVAVPEVTWLAPSVEEAGFRLQGFSGHPNVFASQIGVFIVIVLIARRKRLVGRAEFLGMLLLGFATLVATGSRTTLLAVLTAWALITARNSRFGGAFAIAALGLLIPFPHQSDLRM